MKKLVYTLIASLCLVGCSEDMNEMPQNGLVPKGTVKTLTANVGDTESRTSLGNEGTVLWSAADDIALSNGSAVWEEYTLTSGAGEASATFQAADEAVPEAETYYAYYPAEGVTAASNGTFTVTLPATQTYTVGSFAPDALPMMAVSTTTSFDFKHVCGLLKLTLKNTGSAALSIAKVLVSADEPMSGTATVTCADGVVATLTGGEGVTVTFDEPLQLEAGAGEVVYVALPVDEYTNAKISVITADDKYRTFNAGSEGFAIERAKFSNVELSLESAEIAAFPEVVADDFDDALKEKAGINYKTTVQHIVFKTNAGSDGIVYDTDTKTATVQFAAPMAKLTDAAGMFFYMSALESVDMSCLDTSNVTSMSQMFRNCSSLTELDLSNFDTGKVTHMVEMFNGCFSLTSLDLSKFNTEKVTNMSNMFYGCSSLTSVDLSNFNTEKVMSMSGMFRNCSSLTSLDLSGFNTGNVTIMSSMFYGCSSLTSLDLSNFNTGKVTHMVEMFYGCSSLTELDLSSFNTTNLKYCDYAFLNVPINCAITISGVLKDMVDNQLTGYTNVTF